MTVPSVPETRYARGDTGWIAYQTFGAGPLTILFITNWLQNLDAMWEEPSLARYLNSLASLGRVICFDKRGSGVSDPVPLNALPTIESWMDDARVAMDAAGVDRAALIGDTEGGPMAMVMAATLPDRVESLVLVNSFARWRRAADYPIGMPDETTERLLERYEQHWGVTSDILDLTAPSVANDAEFRRWFCRYQRLSMPRGAAGAMYRWVTSVDVRPILSSIRVPTLIVHRAGNRHHRAAYGRYLAEHIEGSRYIELPGADSFPFHVGDVGSPLDAIGESLTGSRPRRALDRMLATVLFTDIVDSTGMAAAKGDPAWMELLARHDRIARDLVKRYRGRVVTSTGDGVLAVFDGPGRAVTCAARLIEALDGIGITVRAAVHTGEIEIGGEQIGGLVVHIASRILGRATGGQALVSSTVRDLVAGSGIEFTDQGEHELRGVPGRWSLSAAGHVPEPAA